MMRRALLFFCAILTGCEQEISAPELAKCTTFATGETFIVRKRDMHVDGSKLVMVDIEGKAHVAPLISNGSNDYEGECDPIQDEEEPF